MTERSVKRERLSRLPPAGGAAATPRKSSSENYIPLALFVHTGKVLGTARISLAFAYRKES